jgi:ankyrin repeat protein
LFVIESSVVLGIACVTHDNKETVRVFVENDDRASFEADWRCRIRRAGNKYLISYMVECAAKEMIEALLRSGRFDVNVLDPDGKTPLDYAVKRSDNAIVELLRKAGALEHKASDSPHDAVSKTEFFPTYIFPPYPDFSPQETVVFLPYPDFSLQEVDKSFVEERLTGYFGEREVLDAVSAKGKKTRDSKHSCALM